MSPLSPVIWLNERGREAFMAGRPLGFDRYGYICAEDDPLCVQAGPAVEAAIKEETTRLGIERSVHRGA